MWHVEIVFSIVIPQEWTNNSVENAYFSSTFRNYRWNHNIARTYAKLVADLPTKR